MASVSVRTPGTMSALQAAGVEPSSVTQVHNWGGGLLLLLTLWMWLQTLWAVNTEFAIEGAVLFSKYVALYWIVYRLVRDIKGVEYIGWAHVLGCVMWGWIAYTTDVHGRFETPLGPGVDDSNVLGFHLVTGLAFAGMMFIGATDKRRWIAFVAIPLILNAVILTASRSAIIGLVAGGLGCLLFAGRVYRWRLYAAASLGLVLILLLARDDLFWQRAGMIPVIEEQEDLDASSQARIEAFKGEWRMFLDYPFGAGHRGNEVLSPDYINSAVLTREGVRSAHNTVMAVLVDQGIPGIVLFGLLQLWLLAKLFRLRRIDRHGMISGLATFRGAVAGGLFAFWACGLFLNLFKAEVFIWLMGLVAVLDRIGTSGWDGVGQSPMTFAAGHAQGLNVPFSAHVSVRTPHHRAHPPTSL